MFRVAGLVGILLVVSKVLGLARDIVIANYFGTSYVADAFNIAYMLTGNFFILMGGIGGPFYNTVVAMLPKIGKKFTGGSSGKEGLLATKLFLKRILFTSFITLGLVALAMFIFKAQIVNFFINQDGREQCHNVTLDHMNILLPLVAISGPIGILYAILNVYKKYFAPSLSSGVLNLILIVTIVIMGDTANGIALALGTSIGAVASVLFQIPSLLQTTPFQTSTKDHVFNFLKEKGDISRASKKADALIKETINEVKEKLSSSRNKYAHILYPALLSTGMGQILVLVDSYFCDCLPEGSWTAIVMANRLVQMPLGVLLTAFLVPVFPTISERAAEDDLQGIKDHVQKALRALVAMCLPATIIGMIWAEPIIRLLFERGAFTADSTALVAEVFIFMCLTIVPYIYRDTVTRIFFSLGDSKTPLYVITLAIPLKIFLNTQLIKYMGIQGIPLATVIIITFNFFLLLLLLKRKTGRFLCFTI